MGKNFRKITTYTRSISLRTENLAALDTRCAELEIERSTFINDLLAHVLGIKAHPRTFGDTIPFAEDVNRKWLRLAVEMGYDIPPVNRSPVGQGGLVRRPRKSA